MWECSRVDCVARPGPLAHPRVEACPTLYLGMRLQSLAVVAVATLAGIADAIAGKTYTSWNWYVLLNRFRLIG